MGEVKAYRRIHYSGLDADKAGVTGVAGATYAANDSGKLYYWNDALAAWKTGLGYEYVPRAVAAADITQATLTMDAFWQVDGIDLSGIVPAGAVAAHLRFRIVDDAAAQDAVFRCNDTTKAENRVELYTQVANIPVESDGILFLDSDRLLDYTIAMGMATVEIFVLGWFI
ncbi:unnamed protein product [marine sediment metagenome]|uniref:Uncharacterized protein n=1 Tax=marine sediment metagenome TaxID=412755 RepID=X1NNF2_9ZZZZ